MKRQEMFDRALIGVMKQGCKSSTYDKDGDEVCTYYKSKNVRCAVGHVLDIDTAKLFQRTVKKEKLFGTLDELFKSSIGPDIENWIKEEVMFLVDLQNVHDRIRSTETFLEDFKYRMALLAETHDLVYKEPLL